MTDSRTDHDPRPAGAGATPAAGLSIRSATLADVADICDLLNAVDIIEIGRAETDLDSVRADLEHAEMDLARDTWLAYAHDRLVGYGLLWDESGAERIDIDLYNLPGQDVLAERVLAAMEARAAQKAAANGADRAVVHLTLNVRPTLDHGLLVRRGWRTVRRHHVMVRALSPDADPLPVAPPGVSLRDCRDEHDRRRAHALLEETFAEHFDHSPRSYRKWLEDLGGDERIDWSLVWIASRAGEGDLAVLLSRNNRESMGWIRGLGVRHHARGQGIGGYLLRHAFGTYARLGRDTIGLGVDTQNATGALALYEAHGMRLHFAADTWELTVPIPGTGGGGSPA